MVGAIERAQEELQRRWEQDRQDMGVSAALIQAEDALDQYQRNRRKPTRTVLWQVYDELARCLEEKL